MVLLLRFILPRNNNNNNNNVHQINLCLVISRLHSCMASLLKTLFLGIENNDDLIKAKLNTSGVLLIDARKAHAFQEVHALGAVSMPVGFTAAQAEAALLIAHEELGENHSRPIVVHCELGVESANAVKALKRIGFSDVTNAGGLERVQRLQKEVHASKATLRRKQHGSVQIDGSIGDMSPPDEDNMEQQPLPQQHGGGRDDDGGIRRRSMVAVDKLATTPHNNSSSSSSFREVERAVGLDLAYCRAVETTPKDPVERYHASHALVKLPMLRARDGDELVDKLIDAMEEVEVDPGVTLCQQV
jgi:rhodanese-related sulfurtransferase